MSDKVEDNVPDRDAFQSYLDQLCNQSSDRSPLLNKEQYTTLVQEVKVAYSRKKQNIPLTTKDYRRIKRYDIFKLGDEVNLIEKCDDPESMKFYVHSEQVYDILLHAHTSTGHKRLRGMQAEVNKKYANITREVVLKFLSLCLSCQLKKKSKGRGLVVKPILSSNFNSRFQIDLIDMQSQPDGEYKFILNYQDHLSKFCLLFPLVNKSAKEVAEKLVYIFCTFGAPCILQSDNGREFCNQVINSLQQLYPGLKIVHGKPRHSQSQGSVERCNQDVRDILTTWLSENNTMSWARGLQFVQARKNRSYHRGIKRSPYEALFGGPQRIGLADAGIPNHLLNAVQDEEQLEALLRQVAQDREITEMSAIEDETTDKENAEMYAGDGEFRNGDTEELQHETEAESLIVHLFPDENQCFVCEQPVGENLFCKLCNNNIHVQCSVSTNDEGSSNLTCIICHKKLSIEKHRMLAKRALDVQAETMLKSSNKKFKPAKEGDNVLIKIPDVDRSRISPRNVLAIVTNVDEENQLYELGTKDGVINRKYCRNEFQFSELTQLHKDDVPNGTTTIRTTAGNQCGSSQGFTFCNCIRGCKNKFCSCKKKGLLCNSKCHKSLSCTNK